MANRQVSVGVKIDGTAKGYKSATEEAKRATEQLRREMDAKLGKMKGGVSGLESVFKKLVPAIGAAFAAQKVIAFGQECLDLSIKAEGVTNAFKRLNNPTLLRDLRTATRGTVDDLKLMTAAVQANNLGVPVENLATYFEFAHRRARDTGESIDYLVNSIVTGIGKKSTMILDNLGISSAELNEQLKLTPDYATAVSTIIEKSMSQSGEYITTTADSVDQLKTAMTNLKLEVGDVFNDILSKPLADAANSLTDVISGISDLRKQLDLGGANKDIANFVRGNIAAASGTAGGYFMRLLFGGNDLGKGELLIPGAKPIIKPTSTPKPKPSSGGGGTKATDNVFGDGYWQRQVEAAAEWNEFADKLQRKYDLIDLSGKSIASTTLSQIDNINYLVQATEQWQYDWEQIAQMMDSTLSGMFRAGLEGWDQFGQAAINTIKQITAELMARAAVWMLLNVLTGGSASGGMKLGEYLLQGFGITKAVGSGPLAGGGPVLKGRDIYMAGGRYGETLIKNT